MAPLTTKELFIHLFVSYWYILLATILLFLLRGFHNQEIFNFLRRHMPREHIMYSARHEDGDFIYRYVVLPGDMAKLVPKTHLMTESEWRNLGIRMTPGWVNYMRHHSKPQLILFRRPKNT